MDREDVLAFLKLIDYEKTTKLDLSNKDITLIPPEIGNLINLEHLDLSYNNIQQLPKEIGKLKKLKTLLLLRNELEELPPELGNLNELTLIDASHNKFKKLPKEIGKLSNLKTLDASYGQLRELPLSFINLLSLRELYLEENNFVFPPAKVVKRGLYATMYFLTDEKKKREASKVVLQVFNIPDQIKKPFTEYIECFNDIISSPNRNDIMFDIKFMKHDIQPDIKLHTGVQEHLKEFLSFIKENISQVKGETTEKLKSSLFSLEIAELKTQINYFNESLHNKLEEIKSIQEKMQKFSDLLEKKSKKP
ncbi:MAG: leucine-rich repeat domain-containing protein [Chlorobi bacterium]|nr:leucine-rich repeat domain-containing protein [Chlorobiota bacterium]